MPADLLLRLLAVPSVTGNEAALAALLAERYRDEPSVRVGDSLVIGSLDSDRPLVLLVAHLDTVPPTPQDATARRDGDRIVGRGASDMKGGLAVALACFDDPAVRAGRYEVALVCYAREEGPADDNELAAVLSAVPALTRAELAIVLEPTDLQVQLGCLGGLHADVVFRGRAAHSARPWQGDNALTKAGPFLSELHRREPEDVVVDGLVFREVWTPTQAATSNARNVVPDCFTVVLNYRYAPSRTVQEAEERLLALVGGRAEVTITDRAPAGHPHRNAPAVAAFIAASGAPVAPKQAWTDVARFGQVGVPALNYGPGLTAQAHQAGEYVPIANLRAARDTIKRFLATPSSTSGRAQMPGDG